MSIHFLIKVYLIAKKKHAGWGPSLLAQLVNITILTIVYDNITIITIVYDILITILS